MTTRPLLLLALTACAAAPPPALTPIGDLGVKELRLTPRSATLPDGLRLVHERVAGSGAVALVLTVRAGAARDPEEKRGMAHLVEHLSFRGRDDSGQTRWDRYEQLGATTLNAFTDHESTVYVAVVPRVSMAAAVALEADRLRAPLRGVTDEEFAVERDVVRNEILERNERNQEGGLLAWAARALYPASHRYHHPIGGTMETLAAISRADARFFGTRQYRPRNATLTVVGDVTAEEVRQALEKAGGSWNASDPDPLPDLVDVPLEPPDPPAGAIARVQASFRGTRVWIAWTLPGTHGPVAGAGELVSRLLNATVDEDYLMLQGEAGRDVAQVRFFTAPGLMASTLFAEASLRDGRLAERSASAIIDGVVGLARPYDDRARGTVSHAMMTVLSGLVWQTEDLLVRATRYAEADRVTGDARNATERLRRVSGLEIEGLRNYVAAYLTRERARIAVVTPRKVDGRALSTGLDPISLPPPARDDATATAPPLAPLPSPAGARRLHLPNGLEVVLWPRPGFPSVTAALLFRGGRAVANPPGAEIFLDDVLPLRYCGGLPSFRGIGIGTSVLPDGALELAHGGAQNLSAILLSLAERAAAYRYDRWPVLDRLQRETCGTLSPEDERARLWADVIALGKRRLEQQQLATGRSAGRQAVQAIEGALLGNTAYRTPPAGSLEAITAAELEAWHLSSRRPENAILLVVGQLDLAEAEKLARGWFSSWRPPAAPRPALVPGSMTGPDRSPPRLFRITEAGADQAQLLLGCRLPSGSAGESAAGQVLARLLVRDLRLRLREQLGATYGVQESLVELKSGITTLTIQSDVDRAHLGGALVATLGRLDALAAAPPAPALLRKAQLDVFRRLAGPASTDQLAGQATRLLLLGRPLEELERASAAAALVSAQSVRAAATACRASLSVAVVGDAATVARATLPGFAVEELR